MWGGEKLFQEIGIGYANSRCERACVFEEQLVAYYG